MKLPAGDEQSLEFCDYRYETKRHADRKHETARYVQIVPVVGEIVEQLVLEHFGFGVAKEILSKTKGNKFIK